MVESLLNIFFLIWKPIVEILILWFVIYHIMLFFEGTRALHVLRGIIILLVMFFVFQRLDFEVLNWLFTKLFAISIIAILIIFHPELRRGLAHLGQRNVFGFSLRQEELELLLREVLKAAENLSQDKVGALVAIENEVTLKPYIESGIETDALVSAEFIQTVFTPYNPLHDGGLVIEHNRIAACGCLFPLSDNQYLSRVYGMRHRAAIGLSEETDALVIVVSEERGDISLAYRGSLYQGYKKEELLLKIKEIYKNRK
jgi:diadenylate cyclase